MKANCQIIVWDLFIRIYHWLLVALFFLAYVTADQKGPLHRYVGYVVFGLVVIRIIWGFTGTTHARFSDFICSPAKALSYLKELAAGKPKHYIGHNPAAAWMVLFFLIGSIVVCLSGYKAYATKGMRSSSDFNTSVLFITNAYADKGGREGHGNKHERHEKHRNGEKGKGGLHSFWSEVHEISAQFMLFLICIHVVGVFVSSKMHSENLVKSMITGKKGVNVP
jgi:cytochrome b